MLIQSQHSLKVESQVCMVAQKIIILRILQKCNKIVKACLTMISKMSLLGQRNSGAVKSSYRTTKATCHCIQRQKSNNVRYEHIFHTGILVNGKKIFLLIAHNNSKGQRYKYTYKNCHIFL